MSKETKFEWTDELVMEFADFYKSKQGIDYSTWGKCLLDLFKKPKVQVPLHNGSERTYTQSEVDTIREDAFQAGGSMGSDGIFRRNRSTSDVWSFPYYKDYINSLKSPETLTNTVTDNSDVACLSANDIKKWLEKYFDYPNGISVTQLNELVNQKLKQ